MYDRTQKTLRTSMQGPWERSFTGSQLVLRDLLFVLAFATKPLYLLPSGSVQISDLLFVLVFCLFVFSDTPLFKGERVKQWIFCFAALLLYIVAVNTFWCFALQSQGIQELSMLKNSFYYCFDFLVCLVVFLFHAEYGFQRTRKLFLTGISISALVSFLGILLYFNDSTRTAGFFNNPNQLGYFSIIVLTAVTFFSDSLKKTLRILLLVLCVGMTLASLSKACIVSIVAVVFAFLFYSRERAGAAKLAALLASFLVIAVGIYVLLFADWEAINDQPFVVFLRSRMTTIVTENDSQLGVGRGYTRILEVREWLLTGVGEGAYDRFTVLNGLEAHSLYASMLVSYGLIGLFLMAWLFGQALFSDGRCLRNLLCFSGILLYSVTHNSVRSTLLWTLLALLLLRPRKEAPSLPQQTP